MTNQDDSHGSSALVRLGDAGLTVPREQDVRGLAVVDRDGEDIGTVDELLVDEGEHRVRFLEVGSGGFLGIGEEKRLIPVDAVKAIDERVHVDTTRSLIAASPPYDPDVARASPEDFFGGLYGYYGVAPYWGPGYVYPAMPW
ncbi:PRC-barrel domain-containing protein [uncultured Cellulomonas sp.]|uniref:PRC-barrel domain-containing protein n=1 Tax=uncultured Cellulomonas sp. TaxID=189682 RepID=UPI002629AA9E|nr:PRC-barrel domain-containing protein [uncultured Cellulomonas sp.]